MNKFERFLQVTRIAADHRHSAGERASYFLWYHTRATKEQEADLEMLAAYLKESGTSVPDLHQLYRELTGPGQLVAAAPIPGRLRMRNAAVLGEHSAAVFSSKGLAPLYFQRGPDGTIIRVASWHDVVKYWPQRSWLVPWLGFITGLLGILTMFR